MKKLSISLIGTTPPPFGGVSVHLSRLARSLFIDEYDVTVFSDNRNYFSLDGIKKVDIGHGKIRRLLYLLRYFNITDIYHFHTCWNDIVNCSLLSLTGKPVVITIHDQMIQNKYSESSFLRRIAVRIAIKMNTLHFIAVTTKISDILEDMGVRKNRIIVIPAYIPEAISPTAEIPPNILAYIKAHKPVLLIYGYRFSIDMHGNDLYGFNKAIDAVSVLRKKFPKIGLIILIPSGSGTESIEDTIKNFFSETTRPLLYTKPIFQMQKLWTCIDLYLRPTTTDGDSLSVREALSYGIPVIASDVAVRPEGTYTYSFGVDSLPDCIERILKTPKSRNAVTAGNDKHYENIRDYYQNIFIHRDMINL